MLDNFVLNYICFGILLLITFQDISSGFMQVCSSIKSIWINQPKHSFPGGNTLFKRGRNACQKISFELLKIPVATKFE